MRRVAYEIAAAYDTETTNICIDKDSNSWAAYPVLFIVNDLRGCDLRTYEPGQTPITFVRTSQEMQTLIDDYVAWGRSNDVVPVVCAYNLMFDMQPLIYELCERYEVSASAQSSTHVYTLSLALDGREVLRFWDAYYLEMRGLDAMGETCGVAKASGHWDYRLIRGQKTPITDDEKYYAGRDTEVIPAYLRYLLESYQWLDPSMFGVTVLTKTSLVRQQGKHETGRLRYGKGRKAKSVQAMFEKLCAHEIAPTYAQYALRKSCFRGGLTFTAAQYAGICQTNVYSLDETSAHHAYINGHMLPVDFKPLFPYQIRPYIQRVLETPFEYVLAHYEQPFICGIHAQVVFRNLRLKRGSAFEAYQIATLAEGKFHGKGQLSEWGGEADRAADTATRAAGYVDVANNATFAFGKLYKAEWARLSVSEIELYIIGLVYDFDSYDVVCGEVATKFVKPPDYVTLLSNKLFSEKQALKKIIKGYREGEPYTGDIAPTIPPHIAEKLKAGTMGERDLQSYYGSTVKGAFNSIYGTQAQDVFKPMYSVVAGKVCVDADTKCTRENYADMLEDKRSSLVCYTYGLRIVGGSRLALVCAIKLIYETFGDRARVLGGDTDSLKISCDADISGADLIAALAPFHKAVRRSIDVCMTRIRKNFPAYASDLKDVGEFEVEGAPYAEHMEAWNKARVSWDGKRSHITCAGLSRPQGSYHIETWIDERVSHGHSFSDVAKDALGWGTRVTHGVCHALERTHPEPWEKLDLDIVDHMGNSEHISEYQSIALYPSERVIGDISQGTNARTVDFIRRYMGREVDTTERIVDVNGTLKRLTKWGWENGS